MLSHSASPNHVPGKARLCMAIAVTSHPAGQARVAARDEKYFFGMRATYAKTLNTPQRTSKAPSKKKYTSNLQQQQHKAPPCFQCCCYWAMKVAVRFNQASHVHKGERVEKNPSTTWARLENTSKAPSKYAKRTTGLQTAFKT